MEDKNKKTKKIVDMTTNEKVTYNDGKELAIDAGYESVTDLVTDVSFNMTNGSGVQKLKASTKAAEFLSGLSLLTLKQSLLSFADGTDYMSKIVDKYDIGMLTEGNFWNNVWDIATGTVEWDENKFLPTSQTTKIIETKNIAMYVDNGAGPVLAVNAYQFKKPLTIQESVWVPYFKSGTLAAFITKLGENMNKVYKYFIFDKIAKLIASLTPAKTVAGKATDAFDCWVSEIIPLIARTQYLGSEYNYSKDSQLLQTVDLSKVTIFVSNKTKATLQAGLRSQLFNQSFLNISNLINDENLQSLGNVITIGNESTAISVSANEYIGDNDVFFVSNDAIKHFRQVNETGSQYFVENLTIFNVVHIWGALDVMPAGAVFKYSNVNLNKLPDGGTPMVKEGE